MLHPKRLGPRGYEFLTSPYNLSIKVADIRSIWKRANIIPIQKAGKPCHLGSSFYLISLLYPSTKVLVWLLLPILNLSPSLADNQHGFRGMKSTTSALLSLAQKVAVGFNQYTSLLVYSDDCVWPIKSVRHRKPHQINSNQSPPPTYSTASVISPFLFNFFASNYPRNCQLHSAYANDVHAAEWSTNVQAVASALTAHAEAVSE